MEAGLDSKPFPFDDDAAYSVAFAVSFVSSDEPVATFSLFSVVGDEPDLVSLKYLVSDLSEPLALAANASFSSSTSGRFTREIFRFTGFLTAVLEDAGSASSGDDDRLLCS